MAENTDQMQTVRGILSLKFLMLNRTSLIKVLVAKNFLFVH